VRLLAEVEPEVALVVVRAHDLGLGQADLGHVAGGVALALGAVRRRGVLDGVVAALEALLAVVAAVLARVGALDVVSLGGSVSCTAAVKRWAVQGVRKLTSDRQCP
jgi:hypothetical protein